MLGRCGRSEPISMQFVSSLRTKKGGALSQELGSRILTLILDFSEHFVSLSYAAATTARGTFAVSAHAVLPYASQAGIPRYLNGFQKFQQPQKAGNA